MTPISFPLRHALGGLALALLAACGGNSGSNSPANPSPAGADASVPQLAGALGVARLSTNGYTLSWPAATDNVGITGYSLSVDAGQTWSDLGLVLSAEVSGRNPGSSDVVQVRARDAAGNVSAVLSTTVALPAAVDGSAPVWVGELVVSGITHSGYTVGWTAATDDVGVASYQLSLDGGSTWSDLGAVLSTTVTGRSPGSRDEVRLRARDAAGHLSQAVVATIALLAQDSGPDTTAPVFAGNLTVSGLHSSGYNLAWPAASDDKGIAGYSISLNGGSSWTDLGNVLGTAISGRSSGSSDGVRVRARDAAGNISAALATTVALPAMADSVPPVLSGSLVLSQLGTTGYRLAWPAASDNIGIVGYSVSLDGGSTWAELGNVLTTAIGGRSPGSSDAVRLRARDGSGNVSAALSLAVAIPWVVDGAAPVLTGSLGVTGLSNSGYTLSWPAASDDVGVSGYSYSLNGGSTWLDLGNVLTVAVSGRSAGATDAVRVRARDAAGNVSAVLSAAVALPGAVTVAEIRCGLPYIGTVLECRISGSALPSTTAMTASNCVPQAMTPTAGGDTTRMAFSCRNNGSASAVTASVPGAASIPAIIWENYFGWGAANTTVPATNTDSPNLCALPNGQTREQYSANGDFKVYAAGCVASLTLSATEWATLNSTQPSYADYVNFGKRFSLGFRDEYDFLLLIYDRVGVPPGYFYGQYVSLSTRQPTRTRRQMGTMLLPYKWSSATSQDNSIQNSPLLHEVLHEWANHGGLSTAEPGHWGFSSVGGQLGGFYGPAGYTALGSNTWRAYGPPRTCLPGASASQITNYCSPSTYFFTNANGGNAVAYADVELMLMGLIPAAGVAPVQVATNPQWVDVMAGTFNADGWTTVSAAQILTNMGAAAPVYGTAQRGFKIATLVLTDKTALDAETVSRLDAALADFNKDGTPDYGNAGAFISFHNFYTATRGQGTMRVVPLKAIQR